MPASALARLRDAFSFVELPVKMTLERRNMPLEHVYFPTSGIVSIVSSEKGGLNIEAALVGREGMTGLPLVLGDDRSAAEVIMQVPGAGWRLEARALGQLMEDRNCRDRLSRYVHAVMIQIQGTALAYGRGTLTSCLARWLLMCHDRVQGDELPLTHEFMALMLGVRRSGVTVALHDLEGRGLIRSLRGRVLIRDREGLMAVTGGLYGGPEAHYRRLMSQDQPA
ncbi:Crp/Fnr family transcriptional regulator [Limimaricola litoreus]|uniref:Crp/Fnr family transcriptional regulator n=1 Tax=Limimaricola litoreus TaxID=2955316 RepID=UPI00209C9F10|nr:Crp/Fnr family transcriptional regulator [Limimaricola litoreus]